MEPRSSTRLTPQNPHLPPVVEGMHPPVCLADPEDPLGPGAFSGDILIEDARWRAAVPGLERRLQRARDMACDALGLAYPNVLLSSDRAVRRLNHDFRGRNKPTNVLTFEAGQGLPGDIVFGFETVRREAQAASRPIANHLLHLLVHGALHLAGHDHHEAGEARRMEMHEARLLSRLGVPNPWAVREARS
jgi:probable rRNA maturation factor